jgi:hypothetical protein
VRACQRHREAAHVTGGSLVPLRVDTASTAKLAESIIKPTDHIGKVRCPGEQQQHLLQLRLRR